MRVITLLFSLALILFSFGSAAGQGIYLDHVDGLVNDQIPNGATLSFHMRITGDATGHFMLNNGFEFCSPDLIWEAEMDTAFNAAYPWTSWFDFIRQLNDQSWVTGSGCDTVGLGLLSLMGTGLPAGFNDVAFSITVKNITGLAGAPLVLDSCWYPPSNPWMWDVVGENVAWGGPYTFYSELPCVAPAITSTPVTAGVVDEAYSYDVDATGTPAPTYELTTFPTGMTIDEVTGVIDWTPSAAGDFPVTVVAGNNCGDDATQTFSIHVPVPCTAPAIVSTPGTDAAVGVEYVYDVNATGTPAPTYSLSVFPAGMTIEEATGIIRWTPAATGVFVVTVVAGNDCGDDATQSFSIHVCAPPQIVSTPVTDAAIGVPYTYDVNATGDPVPGYVLTEAPGTMTINPVTGLINWTPTAPGDYPVSVLAFSDCGEDVQEFSIHVPCIPAVITTTPPASIMEVGYEFTYDVNATGNPTPTFSLTEGPGDMTINPTTGLISWMCDQFGEFDVTVVASNECGDPAVQSFTVIVYEPPFFTSTPVLDGVVDQLYEYDVNASGYPVPTYSLLTFPGGMTIDPTTGLIQWTPGATGDVDVVVQASSAAGTETQGFTITVVAAPASPVITSTPVTEGEVGELYNYDVEATGNPAPTFALTTKPSGMTIDANTGLIQWTPTVGGDFDVTVTATNGVNPPATQSFTISVLQAPQFTTTPVTGAFVDEPYSYDANATGFPAPQYALLVKPDGMTVNTTTGLVEWTPAAVGDYPVELQAYNDAGAVTQAFTISVVLAPAAPLITSTPVTAGEVGVPYEYDVDATGNPAPTYELTTAPAGMTINEETGLIQWTPSVGGNVDVTVRAVNGVNPPASQSFTITVVQAPAIVSTPIVDAKVGQLYVYNVDATGYPSPTYSLTEYPDGMTIDPSQGVINWIPSSLQTGNNAVTVVAGNGVEPDAVQSFTIFVPDAPYTDCWPQPTILKDLENDRILDVRIYNEDPAEVDQASIVVQGKIPPYTGVVVENGVITTDCFIMRFLGSSGFRPVTADFTSTYTVDYDRLDGSHQQLVGDYSLKVYPGDVTFDAKCDINDVILLGDYFWRGGDEAHYAQYPMPEFMDVNGDGEVNPLDVVILIGMTEL